jgi:hypothetical protein
MTRFLVCGALVLPLLAPPAILAQGVAIEHEPIGCIVAGKFPKMNACFTPISQAKRPRVYFRTEDLPTWYYVEMTSDAPCFSGVLLKPSKALIDKRILYYLDVQSGGSRTAEYDPIVVGSEEECKNRLPVAPVSATGPAAVFPSLPTSGFVTAGGLSAGVVGGGVAAVALVAGGVKLATDGDDTPNTVATTVPVTTVPATPPPVTVPTPAPTALVVACQAAPRAGQAPLRVDFATFPNGATGVYAFQWSFGDGGESSNPNPAHVYTTAGAFNATVRVTSGSQSVTCSRSITVTPPPATVPPPPGPFTLSVGLAGSGSGQVNGPGITCTPDCTESYANGTPVTLTAVPDAASTFFGWSGACTGTGPCTVTMNANQSVTAKFEPKTVVLSVTLTGTGSGAVGSAPGGIACPGDCSEAYTINSTVTLTATPTAPSTFGGWGGACLGVPASSPCVVTMDAAKTATAQFNPPVPGPFTLTVTLAGTGTGSVGSTPTGIACPGDCTEPYANGTMVTLTATPTAPSTFGGWGGACLGVPASSPCVVTMDAAKTATAQFDPPVPGPFTLTVALAGSGTGSVGSTPAGIACPGDCTEPYANATSVTLTPTPSSSPASVFTQWTGDCTGTGACTVSMTANRNVTAQFEALRTLSLQAGPKSNVDGSVSSSPPGVSCSWLPPPSAPCSTSGTFVNGTTVTLTVSSITPGFFTLWEDACVGVVGNTCNVLMNADKNVIVNTQRSAPIPIRSGARLVLSTALAVPEGEGQVVMNGSSASAVRQGLVATTVADAGPGAPEGRRGVNHVEAVLVRGGGRPGTWRFELSGQASVKPGSLRVIAGAVALITGDSVVFRLQGNPGERVVFTFEVED